MHLAHSEGLGRSFAYLMAGPVSVTEPNQQASRPPFLVRAAAGPQSVSTFDEAWRFLTKTMSTKRWRRLGVSRER